MLYDILFTYGIYHTVVISGKTGPLISGVLTFYLRQAILSVVRLSVPDGMIWEDPGFPSLYIQYDTKKDLFFSGHVALLTSLLSYWYSTGITYIRYFYL